MNNFKNKTLELAQATIKTKELGTYRKNFQSFKKSTAALKGNQSISTWQNINNPNAVVNLNVWNRLEAVKTAATRLENTSEFKKLNESIASNDFLDQFEFVDEVKRQAIDEGTFLEIYIYTIHAKKHKEHREKKKTFAEMLLCNASGFSQYSWFQSVKSPEIQLDLYFYKRSETEEIENERIEQDETAGAMMATIEQMTSYETYLPFKLETNKIDLTKTKKSYYKAIVNPETVELGWHNYLSISGKGAPESKVFAEALAMIYPVAYKTKFKSKFLGRDYVVPKMEGFWFVEEGEFEDAAREDWCWKVMIPLPEFVHPKMANFIINELGFECKVKVEFQESAKHVQMLHLGSYDAEEKTLAALHAYIEDGGFEMAGYHREVYITDPMKTPKNKLKTIIRYQVVQKKGLV